MSITRKEVDKIVEAAKVLIERHEERSPTSEYATLGEDGALYELACALEPYREHMGWEHM